jgi:hypothetical protein
MLIKHSEAKVIEADNFSTETKYRMTMEHEGKTYYWVGFIGEYGLDETWYDSEEKKIVEPDWADDVESFFDVCEEKIKSDKANSGRTECGFEVEEALAKELRLQGFPSDLIKQVLRTYPIDQIIFESILKEASIKIDELQKVEVK